MNKQRVKTVILEKHPMSLQGVQANLSKCDQIQVTKGLLYGEDLKPTLDAQITDILLMEIDIPTSIQDPRRFPLLKLVSLVSNTSNQIKTIIHSYQSSKEVVDFFVRAGVKGFILKDDYEAYQNLPSIILSINQGGLFFSSSLFRTVLKFEKSVKDLKLTERQLQVLTSSVIFPQKSTAELAQALGISHSTYRNTLSRVYKKLDVGSRTAAADKAQQLGLIQDPLLEGWTSQKYDYAKT
jgi:DNA-binding NarL/FixJ family response regulator